MGDSSGSKPPRTFSAGEAGKILDKLGQPAQQNNDSVQELLQELTGQIVNRYATGNQQKPLVYVVEIPIPSELQQLKQAGISANGTYSVLGGHRGRWPLNGVKAEYEVDPYVPTKMKFAQLLAHAVATKRVTGKSAQTELARRLEADILDSLNTGREV